MIRVLIVDDNVRRSDILCGALINSGCASSETINTSVSVVSSIAHLKEKKYDLLIIDVIIPWRQDERPSHENGLKLLSMVTSGSSKFFLPSNIIGITASAYDIEDFRVEFENKCTVVFYTDLEVSLWYNRIVEFSQRIDISLARAKESDRELLLITVHGIRTYGQWQHRLETELLQKTDRALIFHYRYGYFSFIRFLVPYFRNKEVERFCSSILANLKEISRRRCTIIAHSFGTYIVVEGIKRLSDSGFNINIHNLVICGSVLLSSHRWDEVVGVCVDRVVNECGSTDIPLCLSAVFVPGTGMAGRVGFHGFSSEKICNRFFNGGHSLYFSNSDADAFMSKHWLPLILYDDIVSVDERTPSMLNGVVDSSVCFFSSNKLLLPLLFFFAIIAFFCSKWFAFVSKDMNSFFEWIYLIV